MTWDRFDDAMNDVNRDRRQLRREIEDAETKLISLGRPLPERSALPESREDGPQGLYQDAVYGELGDRLYLSSLRKALDDAKISGED